MQIKNAIAIVMTSITFTLVGCAGDTETTIATSTDVSNVVADTAGVSRSAEETSNTAVSTGAPTANDQAEVAAAEEESAEEESQVPEIPEKLEIGDPAPGIHYTTWITGDEVAEFEAGKVHVVEFWATWCPPCRASMPHLSSLQEQYADDVKFISFTDENLETVESFLAKPSESDKEQTWSEVVKYSLVSDEDRVMHRSYLAATGQNGIPAAYIVGREGHLLWKGHPMMGMDQALEEVVAGDWNIANAAQKAEAAEAIQVARMNLQRNFGMAMRDEDWDEALSLFDEMLADPEIEAMIGENAVLQRYQLLAMAGRAEETAALADEIKEQFWEDAEHLGRLAQVIAGGLPDSAEHDFGFALELANRANELTGGTDAKFLSTVALVHHAQGDLDAAIEWQQKAVDNSDGDENIAAALEKLVSERDTPVEEPGEGDEGAEEDTVEQATVEQATDEEENTETAELEAGDEGGNQ